MNQQEISKQDDTSSEKAYKKLSSVCKDFELNNIEKIDFNLNNLEKIDFSLNDLEKVDFNLNNLEKIDFNLN